MVATARPRIASRYENRPAPSELDRDHGVAYFRPLVGDRSRSQFNDRSRAMAGGSGSRSSGFHGQVHRADRRWFLSRTPSWTVARRLHERVHGWYRIPTLAAAEHVRLRFDIWPIEMGDHVRLECGRLTAVAYSTAAFSEIIFVLPDGELEPDPRSSEMARAWARFAASRRLPCPPQGRSWFHQSAGGHSAGSSTMSANKVPSILVNSSDVAW